MSADPSADRPLPGSWQQVLDQVLATMDQAITTAAEREEALRTADPAEVAKGPWEASLAALDERLEELAKRAGGAAEQAGCADQALAGTTLALRQWLGTAAAVRQRLEEGVRRPV